MVRKLHYPYDEVDTVLFRSATSIIIFLTYSIVFLSENDILINTEHANWTN